MVNANKVNTLISNKVTETQKANVSKLSQQFEHLMKPDDLKKILVLEDENATKKFNDYKKAYAEFLGLKDADYVVIRDNIINLQKYYAELLSKYHVDSYVHEDVKARLEEIVAPIAESISFDYFDREKFNQTLMHAVPSASTGITALSESNVTHQSFIDYERETCTIPGQLISHNVKEYSSHLERYIEEKILSNIEISESKKYVLIQNLKAFISLLNSQGVMPGVYMPYNTRGLKIENEQDALINMGTNFFQVQCEYNQAKKELVLVYFHNRFSHQISGASKEVQVDKNCYLKLTHAEFAAIQFHFDPMDQKPKLVLKEVDARQVILAANKYIYDSPVKKLDKELNEFSLQLCGKEEHFQKYIIQGGKDERILAAYLKRCPQLLEQSFYRNKFFQLGEYEKIEVLKYLNEWGRKDLSLNLYRNMVEFERNKSVFRKFLALFSKSSTPKVSKSIHKIMLMENPLLLVKGAHADLYQKAFSSLDSKDAIEVMKKVAENLDAYAETKEILLGRVSSFTPEQQNDYVKFLLQQAKKDGQYYFQIEEFLEKAGNFELSSTLCEEIKARVEAGKYLEQITPLMNRLSTDQVKDIEKSVVIGKEAATANNAFLQKLKMFPPTKEDQTRVGNKNQEDSANSSKP